MTSDPVCESCGKAFPRFTLDGHQVCEWCLHNPTTARRNLRRSEKRNRSGVRTVHETTFVSSPGLPVFRYPEGREPRRAIPGPEAWRFGCDLNPARVMRQLLESEGFELPAELISSLSECEKELAKEIDGERKIEPAAAGEMQIFVPSSQLSPEMVAAIDSGKTFIVECRDREGRTFQTRGVKLVRTPQ